MALSIVFVLQYRHAKMLARYGCDYWGGVLLFGVIIQPIEKQQLARNPGQNTQGTQKNAAAMPLPAAAQRETNENQGNTEKQTRDWHEAIAPPTWGNWALVLIGTIGICAALRSLGVLKVQTSATEKAANAAQLNAKAALRSERAYLDGELERNDVPT